MTYEELFEKQQLISEIEPYLKAIIPEDTDKKKFFDEMFEVLLKQEMIVAVSQSGKTLYRLTAKAADMGIKLGYGQ